MSLKSFQKYNNLIPDGIMGVETALKIKEVFNLNIIESSHFLAQLDHETAGFKYSRENLNYSWEGLRRTFKKYFPTVEIAQNYQRNPERIANRVYANRMGNGTEHSGDGWKYAGKSAIQLTGKNNYTLFSRYKGDRQILNNPDIVATKYYLDAAIWFFEINNIFDLCLDITYNTIRKVTRKINGGYNGLRDRERLTKKYYKIFKDNERQDPDSSNSSISSSNWNTMESKKQEGKTIISGTAGEQNKPITDRFLDNIKKWNTKKDVGRYPKREGDN